MSQCVQHHNVDARGVEECSRRISSPRIEGFSTLQRAERGGSSTRTSSFSIQMGRWRICRAGISASEAVDSNAPSLRWAGIFQVTSLACSAGGYSNAFASRPAQTTRTTAIRFSNPRLTSRPNPLATRCCNASCGGGSRQILCKHAYWQIVL